ncbi:MAG TPA: hypothetical protein VF800_21540 [Telluria sp.]|jgi:hypothetical protein
MKFIAMFGAACVLLNGCTAVAPLDRTGTGTIAPAEAVQLAAASAPAGVPGIFALRVQATGRQNGYLYLNSEADYRDQRNLSIAVSPSVIRVLTAQLGQDPAIALQGKRLLVSGDATRVPIHFVANGRMTDKYYYQTHVAVTDAAQIEVLRPHPDL